ncbi:hypothetical protein DCMF_17955 [Candidatus Formimonas warabiya]|uniref:Uncharacterized protein n=1 Tax=Formimonas warabiya TaxID=1761012 RepID=A0A3G1KVB3_FORW1|nr:hypothetical protein DCMF_17955 [Candidatus Formimonas warabiya]
MSGDTPFKKLDARSQRQEKEAKVRKKAQTSCFLHLTSCLLYRGMSPINTYAVVPENMKISSVYLADKPHILSCNIAFGGEK